MHKRLIAHESIRLSQSELKSANFSRSTVVDEFRKRKVKIHKVKVRSASDLRSMVRKDPTRNRWLKRIAEKEVAGRTLWKLIMENWQGVSVIRNPKLRKGSCGKTIAEEINYVD